jgi:RNA polymerase primary sigma factor
LVREIIDIDTNYMEDESTGQSSKKKIKDSDEKNNETETEIANGTENDDEFNPTLSAMEAEIKPKVLNTVNDLTKNYNNLLRLSTKQI